MSEETMQDDAATTKAIDPCALASLTTGAVLCEEGFGPVAEAAGWVLGHPIWTHEFIDPEINRALTEAILGQFPEMPTDQPKDWRALMGQVRDKYGATVLVRKGTRQRNAHPLQTLEELLSPQQRERVVVVQAPETSA